MSSFLQTISVSQAYANQWQSQLMIDWDEMGEIKFNDADLRILMLNDNFTKECIRSIAVYKCPLYDNQLIQLLDNHQFVVLQTDNCWYSIEKNSHFIQMQRSNHIANVQCYIRKDHRRTPIKGISFDSCQQLKTMSDLIHFLLENQELGKIYDPVFSNCQAFAKRIFDKFAATKKHEIMLGCSPTLEVTPVKKKAVLSFS